jgi:hypothetical protein
MTSDSARDYQDHVGSLFEVQGTNLQIRLEAVEVFETIVTEGFALQFSGPLQPTLSQGIRALHHSTLGALDLFLVPVMDTRTDARIYEAVFNRLKPSAQAPAKGGA